MAKSKIAVPRKRSKSKNELSDRQATHLFKKMEKAPALFASRAQVKKFNKTVDEMQWIRRAGTILLEMSGKKLIERVEKERGFATTLVSWYDRVDDYVEMLDDIRALMGDVQMRFMIALHSRTDVDEILAAGRKGKGDNKAAGENAAG